MQLYDYQKIVVDKCLNYFKTTVNPKPFNIFFKMGLGKTFMAINIAKQLDIKSLLIICPKSLISMWENNIAQHYNKQYTLVNKLTAFGQGWDNTVIYITTYEEFLNYNKDVILPDLCIFDEVHKVKNTLTKTHKQIAKYIRPDKTITLSGTPITNNLMDLFGVLTCVGSQEFDGISRTRYHYKYILNGGAKSKAELIDKIKPYTVIGDLEEYVEMPGYEDIVLNIEPTPEFIKQQYLLATDSFKPPLARIIDCQRHTSGISDGLQLMSSNKFKICVDLVNDIIDNDEKVIIFTKYDAEFDYLTNYFKEKCTGINGKTRDRETPVFEFQNNPNIKIFIGNLQTASLGLTLTAASKCIIYSETFDWAAAEQARARIYRIGQTHFCTYYHLLYKNTIDELIYQNNLNKTDLIEDFKKYFGGKQ